MKKSKQWAALGVAAAATAAFSFPVAAQTTTSMGADRPHFYAGGAGSMNDDEEFGWKVLGGYQFNRYFAAEAGYSRLGDTNANGTWFNPRAWEASGVGAFPIGPVSVFGRLGLYRGTKTPGSDNTDLTYGAGVMYDLTPNVALRGEVQRYVGLRTAGSDHDMNVFSIGAVYRFK
jgi:OOP family OmpA-OmpF porin